MVSGKDVGGSLGRERKHRRQRKCSPRRTVLELASSLLRQEITVCSEGEGWGKWVPQSALARLGMNKQREQHSEG